VLVPEGRELEVEIDSRLLFSTLASIKASRCSKFMQQSQCNNITRTMSTRRKMSIAIFGDLLGSPSSSSSVEGMNELGCSVVRSSGQGSFSFPNKKLSQATLPFTKRIVPSNKDAMPKFLVKDSNGDKNQSKNMLDSLAFSKNCLVQNFHIFTLSTYM